jgi:hypothetical protein
MDKRQRNIPIHYLCLGAGRFFHDVSYPGFSLH